MTPPAPDVLTDLIRMRVAQCMDTLFSVLTSNRETAHDWGEWARSTPYLLGDALNSLDCLVGPLTVYLHWHGIDRDQLSKCLQHEYRIQESLDDNIAWGYVAGLCGDGGPPIDTDEAHAGFLMAGHDMNDMTRPETDARSQAAEAVLLAFTSDALYEELAEVMPESVRRCSAAMRVALAALRAEVEVRGKESMSHHPM